MSQTDVPAYPLSEALRVPRALYENYGGDPTKPLEVAAAMELKPGSSHFKMLTGAAIAYGLTEGGYNAAEVSLTPLASRILKPMEEGAEIAGQREAFQRPRIIAEFLQKYDGSPVPKENIARNVLSSMGVPEDRTEASLEMIISGASELGLTREIKGTKYINLTPAGQQSDGVQGQAFDEEVEAPAEQSSVSFQASSGNGPIGADAVAKGSQRSNRRVFITHGKNQAFISPIRKLLQFGEMEAVVSIEEQSVSKALSDKVMDDMRSCGAAIVHVEEELRLLDGDGNEHFVLNPNVLIEIGAAMALYGRRFILLVKQGASLPSNLRGLYTVLYSGEALDGEATIKLLEAINDMKNEEFGG